MFVSLAVGFVLFIFDADKLLPLHDIPMSPSHIGKAFRECVRAFMCVCVHMRPQRNQFVSEHKTPRNYCTVQHSESERISTGYASACVHITDAAIDT